jgi:hypothetical protein
VHTPQKHFQLKCLSNAQIPGGKVQDQACGAVSQEGTSLVQELPDPFSSVFTFFSSHNPMGRFLGYRFHIMT